MPSPPRVVAFKPGNQPLPTNETGTVPNRKANDSLRTRSYLTEAEIEALRKMARQGRQGHRDQLMVLLAYRHGLRISELCDLQWTDLDFHAGTFHVRRLKGSRDSTHFLEGDELRGLRRLHKASQSPFVFVSERGGPISPAGFRKQLSRLGRKAGLDFPVHPHMLRHACGYALASRGMDTRSLQHYLGHASIQHTVRYTELSPARFRGIWR